MYKVDKQKLQEKSFENAELTGKTVMLRSCLNVLDKKSGEIIDETRLKAGLPTIREVGQRAAKLLIMGHAGRPKGEVVEALSLVGVRDYYQEKLGQEIVMLPADLIEAQAMIESSDAKLFMLENIRFFPGEKSKDESQRAEFARALAGLGDTYVNDAFPDYNKSVSCYDIAQKMPSFLGSAFVAEVEALSRLVDPKRPFLAVFGGAKLSEKLDSLKALLPTVDKVLIGGAMAYTLMKAQGIETGDSLVEEEKLDVAKQIVEEYADKLLLPVDHLLVDEFSEPKDDSGYVLTQDQQISQAKLAVDIGDKTIEAYVREISQAGTILWNGPMGVFEWERAGQGTKKVAEAIAGADAFTIAGGGDSLAAISKYNISGLDHISTGGGALLAFLAYDEFPVLDVILS